MAQQSCEIHEDLTAVNMKSTLSSSSFFSSSSYRSSPSNSPSHKSPQTSAKNSIAIVPATARLARPFHAPAQLVWQTWQSWESVAVTLRDIPREITTYLLWKVFSREGNITAIDIFDDRHGFRTSRGRIRFRYASIACPNSQWL